MAVGKSQGLSGIIGVGAGLWEGDGNRGGPRWPGVGLAGVEQEMGTGDGGGRGAGCRA
jgi:hypothetical protein